MKCENNIIPVRYNISMDAVDEDGESPTPQILEKIGNDLHALYGPSSASSASASPVRSGEGNAGLAVTKQGYLVTLNSAREGNRYTEVAKAAWKGEGEGERKEWVQVVLLNPESGRVSKRFPLVAVAVPAGPPSKPRFIAVWDDRLLVSDLGRNRIYVLSLLTGDQIMEFGRPGRGPGAFSFVSGLAVDADGNILAGDAKANRILASSSSLPSNGLPMKGGFGCSSSTSTATTSASWTWR